MVPLLLLILGHATDAGTPLLALAAHDDHFCDQFCCVYRYCIYFVLYISTLSQVCFVYIFTAHYTDGIPPPDTLSRD